jgi:lipoprotein-anchoring transpeptidase ErfK/SrfK
VSGFKRRLLIVASGALAAGTTGAIATFAYDASRKDVVASGVEVGGVEIGDLSKEEAQRTLDRRLEPLLQRPVLVRYRRREFRFSAANAGVSVDAERTMRRALAESRKGNALSRTVRDLTGGSVSVDLPARIRYSRSALAAFVREVKRSLDRAPRDATVRLAGAGLRKVASRNGVSVRSLRLEEAISETLARPDARVVQVPVKSKRPRVTTQELAAKYSTFIAVDRGSFRLRLFKRLKLVRTYRIGVGRAGYETPTGLYRIQNKAVNPSWFVPKKPWAGRLAGKVIPPGPDNPIKARWLGIYDGAGIHGTADVVSIGTAASHGCIRMLIPEVEQLYERVPVGTPVYIS